jgi:ribosomal 50S subunit-recycling heat shock protein
MRIDKFLKVSQIIKRRTVAKELCDLGRVLINEKKVKASHEVIEQDIIHIGFGHKPLTVRVLSTDFHPRHNKGNTLFEIIQN